MMNSAESLNAALGITLSAEQWSAVGASLEPAVMVAGAGSGKTMSMAARVAWLVGSGQVAADRVLGLTFTNKAAGELTERIRTVLSSVGADPEREPMISTYHAFADRILAEHGLRIGREPSQMLLSDAARASMAYRTVCRSTLDLGIFGTGPDYVTRKLLRLDAELVELDISPDELREFDERLIAELDSYPSLQKDAREIRATAVERTVLSRLVDEWRNAKAEANVFDFSDQIRLALQIVRAYPVVADSIRARFDVVLLDEYQDTSLAQRHLLETLFGRGHAITAVGDPCQAIYGWRGASVQNIEQFPDHFRGEHEVSRYPLSVNRRSGASILRVANAVAADLRDAHASIRELTPVPDRGEGEVRCGLFRTADEEIDWIVADIIKRGSAGRWGDIAVLSTTIRGLASINQRLREAGVPTQLLGAAALLKQPVVVEVLSLLEVVNDPTANAALIRVLTNPRWAIGPRDLAALGRRARRLAGFADEPEPTTVTELLEHAVAQHEPVEAISLAEALVDLGDLSHYSAQAPARFAELAAFIDHIRQHAAEPVGEVLMRVIDGTGIGVELELGDDALMVQEQRRALRSLLSLTAEITDRGSASVPGFLAALREAERLNADIPMEQTNVEDAVRLMTIYKAKGLEFPQVYVPFMSVRAFPGHKQRGQWLSGADSVPWPLREDCPPELMRYSDPAKAPTSTFVQSYRAAARQIQLLDDQRLAYVAMTRAEQSLTVTGYWWGRTQKKRRGPHPFLSTVHAAVEPSSVVCWVDEEDAGTENPSTTFARGAVPWPVDNDRGARVRRHAEAVRKAGVLQPSSERAARWYAAAEVLLAEERARRSAERVVRLPDAVSASTWIRAQEHPEEVAASILRPMPTQPSRVAERGTRVHAWIESRLGQQSLIDPFDLPGSADDDIPTDAAVAALQEAFERSEFAERVPVATEQPFAVLIDGRVVRGRIDAVFREGDRFLIVDWKTGRHHDPMQLAIYRAAWAQISGIAEIDIDAAFFVIGPNELIRPEALPEVRVDRPLGH